jgi:hypothetical protein
MNLGQPNAIANDSFEELGQFPVIRIAFLQRSWANWKLVTVEYTCCCSKSDCPYCSDQSIVLSPCYCANTSCIYCSDSYCWDVPSSTIVSIVSCHHYCIATPLSCYVLPLTRLVLNVAPAYLYLLSRVSCQYRTFYLHIPSRGCLGKAPLYLSPLACHLDHTRLASHPLQDLQHGIPTCAIHPLEGIVCYTTCTVTQYTTV